MHLCISAHLLCISSFPHFHISAYVSEFLYFRAAQCIHAYICRLLCFRIFALQNFADVRRCSQILVDSGNSFMDVRRCSACLPFRNSVFIHFCWDLSESVGVIRMESVGGVWAGIAKRNNKRLIASDVPRSFFFLSYNRECQSNNAMHAGLKIGNTSAANVPGLQ